MTTQEITKLIDKDLDSRGLAKPNIRKNALRRVLEYMETSEEHIIAGEITLPPDKEEFKEKMERIKGKKLNDAESSVINMIYKYCK